jgi:hypothetical protein
MVDKQSKFSEMAACLILAIIRAGYQVTFGCARCVKIGHHRKNSLHYSALAVDLNLFLNGKYLTKTEDHQRFGELWESWGGSWGGRFGDGNHYSLEHDGMK